jgi:hypothetical protein
MIFKMVSLLSIRLRSVLVAIVLFGGAEFSRATTGHEPQAQGSPGAVAQLERDSALLDRLEWRSVFSFGPQREFGMYDPQIEYRFWIGGLVSPYGIEVVRYDAQEKSLVLRMGQRTRAFELGHAGVSSVTPAVRLVPLSEEEEFAAHDEAVSDDVPMVTLVAPVEGDPLAVVGLAAMEEMENTPLIELAPPAKSDEMLLGADQGTTR